ncbi:MAG: hypothetical protein U0P45_00400 [Acidimicrobiales bacterium]
MTPHPTTLAASPRTGHRRHVAAALLGATVLVGTFAGTASAKEVGSGGGTVTTTACSPVTSLSYKGDATTSDTGVATVQVNYGVKSCTKDPVTAAVTMFQSTNPTNILYSNPTAPLSGKFTVGVTARVSYQVRVDVYDAATGVRVGGQTIFAAAVPKGV